MNRILVILTIDTDNLPSDFPQILQREREVVAQWKKEGYLDQLFLRPAKNGAVLILKGVDLDGANRLMESLPFYALKKSLELIPLIHDPQI